jgi:hypothetical protein
VLLTYLNPFDHYDHATGTYGGAEPRAPSGQAAPLYELEGPGGLLLSHHARAIAQHSIS